MQARMRALIVVFRGYSHFGIEAYLNGLLPQLVVRGIDSTVLVLGPVEPQARSLLEAAGVEVLERPVGEGATIPARIAQRRKRQQVLRDVLAARHYDVVHLNTSGAGYHQIALAESLRAGVPIRIAHAHSAMPNRNLLARMLLLAYRPYINKHASHLVACSAAAGTDLYGDDAWQNRGIVARNGIDTARFSFNPEIRKRMRSASPDAFIIGFVGRLAPQKNPGKLLTAFAAYAHQDASARLWVVGDGELRSTLEREAQSLHIADRTVFWGDRADIPDLLQGMDCLVMPSRFEGLPIALLEAQANGLPCIISDAIDPAAAVPECPVTHLSPTDSDATWASAIARFQHARIANAHALVRAAGYDMRDSAAEMARLYRGDSDRHAHTDVQTNGEPWTM